MDQPYRAIVKINGNFKQQYLQKQFFLPLKMINLFDNYTISDILQFQFALNNENNYLPLISPMSSWVLSLKKTRMGSDSVSIKVFDL